MFTVQRTLSFILCFLLLPVPQVFAAEAVIALPLPGSMVQVSPAFNPVILKGIKVHAEDPFKFEFVLSQGDSTSAETFVEEDYLKSESTKLIKYFLAALTTPEKDLWVNLSPYEKDRIVPESFGQTEMGRDLLAQDYLLKQLTASLVYPEDELGKNFWRRVYDTARNKNIPMKMFNKVWIVPEKAVIYENVETGTAYVVESSLKVLTERDYQAGLVNQGNGNIDNMSQIVKDIVIPQLTKEVNEGKNFAQLRQVYHSMILATWYKNKIRKSILTQVYADKNKVKGVDYHDALNTQVIYQKYLEAFKKGAYNYIKDEMDPVTQKLTPRKYFSGGVTLDVSKAMSATTLEPKSTGREYLIDTNFAMAAVRVSKFKYFEALVNKLELIDITEFLGSLAPYGQFNEAFSFEVNGFKPGKVAIGIGYGKTNDIILMENKLNECTFKRMRDGKVISLSIWAKTEEKDEKTGARIWKNIQKQDKRRMDDPVRSLEDFYANLEESYQDSPGTIGLAKLIFEVGNLRINKEKIGSLVGMSLRPTNSDGSSTFSLFDGHVKIPVLKKADHQYMWHPVILHERMVGDIYEFTVRSTASTFKPIDRTFRIGEKTKDIIWRGQNRTIYVMEPVDQIPMRMIQKLINAQSTLDIKKAVESLGLIAGQNVDITEDTGQIKIFLGNGDFYRWAVLGMTQGGWDARVLGARVSDSKDSVILSMVLTRENGTHIIKVFEFGKEVATSEKGMKYFIMVPKIFNSFEEAFNEGGKILKKYPKRLSLDMMGNTTIIFSNGKMRSNAYLVTYKNGEYEKTFGVKNGDGTIGRFINNLSLEETEDDSDMAMGSDVFSHPGNKIKVNLLKQEAHAWLLPVIRREVGLAVSFEKLVERATGRNFYLGKLSAGKILLPIYKDKDYTRQLLDSSFSKTSTERSGWETWLTNVRLDHGSIRFNIVLIKREMNDDKQTHRKIVQEYVINPYIMRDVVNENGNLIEVLEIVKAEDFPAKMLSAFLMRPKDFTKLQPMMLGLLGSVFGFTFTAGEVLFPLPNKLYPEKNLFLISKTLGIKDMTQWKAIIKEVIFNDQVMNIVFGVSKDGVDLPDVRYQASPALQETSVNIKDPEKTLDVVLLDKRLGVRGLEHFALFKGDAKELIASGFSLKGLSFGDVNAAGAVSVTPKSGRTFSVPVFGVKDSGIRGEIIDEKIYSNEGKIFYEFVSLSKKNGELPFIRQFVASKNIGDASVDSFDIAPIEATNTREAMALTLDYMKSLEDIDVLVKKGEDPRLRIVNRRLGSNFYSIYFQGLQPGSYKAKILPMSESGVYLVTLKDGKTTFSYKINTRHDFDLENYLTPLNQDVHVDELQKFANDFKMKHPSDRVQSIRQEDQKLRLYWEDNEGNIHRAIVTEDFIKSIGYRHVKFVLLGQNSKEYILVKDAMNKSAVYGIKQYLKAQAEDDFPREYKKNKENLKRIYAATPAVVGIAQLIFEGVKNSESLDVLNSLIGKALPKTDKQGRSIFSVFPNHSVNLYVLGKAEAEWQPIVENVRVNALGFYEITVTSYMDGQDPIEKTFEIGRFKRKISWNGYLIPTQSIILSDRIRYSILRNAVLKKGVFNPARVSNLLNQLKGVILGPSLLGGNINVYLTSKKRMPWYFAAVPGQSMRILEAQVNDAKDSVLVTVLVWDVAGSYQIRTFELGKKVVKIGKSLEHYEFNPVFFKNKTEALNKVKPIISDLEKPLERDPFLGNVILEFPDVIEGLKHKVIHNGEYFTLFSKKEQMYKDRILETFRRILQNEVILNFINSDDYQALPLNRKLGVFMKFIKSQEFKLPSAHMGKVWRSLQKLSDEDETQELDWGNIGGYNMVYQDYIKLVDILERKFVHRFIIDTIVKGHLKPNSTLNVLKRYLNRRYSKFFDRISLTDLYLAIPMQYRSYFVKPDAAMFVENNLERHGNGLDHAQISVTNVMNPLGSFIKDAFIKYRDSFEGKIFKQRTERFFQLYLQHFEETDEKSFWFQLMYHSDYRQFLRMIFNDFDVSTLKKKQRVHEFARMLVRLWQEKDQDTKESMEDKYGSLFPIMALQVMRTESDSLLEIRKAHEWLYEFLSVADIQDQARSLWFVIVGNVIHLRFLGMHPEEEEGRGDTILNDLEILFGNEMHVGVVKRFVNVMKKLKEGGYFTREEYIKVGQDLSLKDMLFWGLDLVRDASIHNPQFYFSRTREQNRLAALASRAGGNDQYMKQSLQAAFKSVGLEDQGIQEMFIEASAMDWDSKGLTRPEELKTMYSHFGVLFIDDQFLGRKFKHFMYAFLRKDFKFQNEVNTSIKDPNKAFKGTRTLMPLNKRAWQQAFPELAKRIWPQDVDNVQIAKGGIDLTSERMNVETKLSNSQPIAFRLDPVQLAHFKNAPGFEPVIVSILPLVDLHSFLSIK